MPHTHRPLTPDTTRLAYYQMYQGQWGDFFDTLSNSNLPSLFPRLENLLKSKKRHWESSIPLVTNYFRTIAHLIGDFTLGEGVHFSFPHEGPDARSWYDLYQDQNIDQHLTQTLHQMVATGYAGLRLSWSQGRVVVHPLTFQNVLTSTESEKKLCWVMSLGDNEERLYVYHITYSLSSEGWRARHEVFDWESEKHLGKPRPDVLKEMGQFTLDKEGYEPHIYQVLPFVLFHAPHRDTDQLGRSLYSDIVNHVQTLAFLETMANTELEHHFLSKLALPRSMVMTAPDGTALIQHTEYMAYEDGGALPTYVQKDNKFFDDLFRHITQIKHDIALQTGIPSELLNQEGSSGAEKVELAKIRQQPFCKLIAGYQRCMREGMNQLFTAWASMTGNEIQTPQWHFPSVFDDVSLSERAQLLAEYQAGLISKTQWAKTVYPELSEKDLEKLNQ